MPPKLQILGRGPGYLHVAYAGRPELGTRTITEEAYARHAARVEQVEQQAAARAVIARKLAIGANYLAKREADKSRAAERARGEAAARKLEAQRIAKRRAEDATVSAYLKINAWRISPAQAIKP